MLRITPALLLLALIYPALAVATPQVTVSILPIHSLTSRIMQGVAKPVLLTDGKQSPHSFQLKPSQRRTLERSDLLIWVGPSMEGFLRRISESLPDTTRQLVLMDSDLIRERLMTSDHAHEAQEGHHDEHELADPHIWLSPKIAIAISQAINGRLGEMDPEHASQYQENTEHLVAELKDLDSILHDRLAPLGNRPFVVYHDAYGYLVRDYGLRQVGVVTLDEHRMPGAGHLRSLRKTMLSDKVQCLFTEPQFEPRLVDNLLEGTQIRAVALDPLGAGLTPGPDAYFILMQALADSLEECLD